jgi:hypothetical protein
MTDTPTLWVDTSIARSLKKLRILAELAQPKGVRVVIPAQVHLESYRQTREAAASRGAVFTVEQFRSGLAQLNIRVADMMLDMPTAEAWGEIIYGRYPGGDAWKAAKLSCLRARLPAEAELSADRVPLTTDWLMSLEVERQGYYVAVEDRGEEWAGLRAATPKRALTYEEALAWLRARA